LRERCLGAGCGGYESSYKITPFHDGFGSPGNAPLIEINPLRTLPIGIGY
jgi:hypothetical protein